MPKDDKLFNFMHRLQGWYQAELRRQGMKDLPTAMAAANDLVDYKAAKTDNVDATPKPQSKGFKKVKNKNGDEGK